MFIGTIFNCTGLAGTSFKNSTFRKISIKYTDFSKAILDGAKMEIDLFRFKGV
ncbi:pentapeptide repeat-containing protein [Bacillus sp. F19]|nr:pentapeptide repeat-containing protein [Bacillus sp. F19]